MSYNRGKYLLNCIESVKRNFDFDYELIVFDDGSQDPETLRILQQLAHEVRVFRATGEMKSKKHKGLYANMNRALQYAIDNGFEILAIIQDDLQIIRKVNRQELQTMFRILNLSSMVVVVPLFFKKNHQKDYANLLAYNADFEFYYAKSNELMYLNGIADIGFFSVKKLTDCSWQFDSNETRNIKKGMQLGFKRAVLKNPFMAYLPWPETHRYRISNFNDWITSLTDIWFKAGFHPFKNISETSLQRLFSRSHEIIPFAEDYLELADNVKLKKPWNYYESSFPVRHKLKSVLRKIYYAFAKA